jgi:hypothetical protein
MVTAQADKKGRVTLGRRFAGKTVLIKELDDSSVMVTAAVVIPEQEAWLYQNQEARQAVRTGLNQAGKKEFVRGPDLAADAKLVAQLDD